MINKHEAVGGMKNGRGNLNTRSKLSPVPLRPTQISHDLTWDRTRAGAVESRRLTAWTMALPYKNCNRINYHSSFVVPTDLEGARGNVVGSGTMLQAGRSPVRVLDDVDFFNLPNPSRRTMALGSTQYQEFSWGLKRPARRADNLAECLKMWEPQPLATLKASTARKGITLPFFTDLDWVKFSGLSVSQQILR
jgi:hypothetical protein